MYLTYNLSGGHLNPAVSLAGAGTGHIDLVRGLLYAIVQILGAIAGALVQVGLVYDNSIGHPSESCFSPPGHVTGPELWGWEFIGTFFFLAGVRWSESWGRVQLHDTRLQLLALGFAAALRRRHREVSGLA